MAQITLEIDNGHLDKAVGGIQRLDGQKLVGQLIGDQLKRGYPQFKVEFPEQGEDPNLVYGRKCLVAFLLECIRLNEQEQADATHQANIDALVKPVVDLPDDVVQ